MSTDIFGSYGDYYDLLYRDKDYAGEVEYIVQALRAAAPTAKTILEFGSGTGRHGRLLAEQGFDLIGVEGSDVMTARAKAVSEEIQSTHAGNFDCVHGDIRTVAIKAQFDVVLALFHVVSYQTRNEDLLATFNNAVRHLNPQGVFIFDVWHGPAVLTERPSVRVKRMEDKSTLLTRIAEPELDSIAGTVTVNYTMLAQSKADAKLTNFSEEHQMRYLFPTEVDLLARQTGFIVERTEEFMTGAAPSENTWGVFYILRKQ
jgi:SAM-dependent methyltransferase